MLVIPAIMPALAIILYSGLEQRQRSIDNAQQNVLLLTQSMAEAQQEFTRSVRQMLAILSVLPEIQSLKQWGSVNDTFLTIQHKINRSFLRYLINF